MGGRLVKIDGGITAQELAARIGKLSPSVCMEILVEVILYERAPGPHELPVNADFYLASLRCPDPVGALAFAVRETILDAERVFSDEEAAAIEAAIAQLMGGGAP